MIKTKSSKKSAIALVGISILQYHNSTVAEYEENGRYAAKVISDRLDRKSVV